MCIVAKSCLVMENPNESLHNIRRSDDVEENLYGLTRSCYIPNSIQPSYIIHSAGGTPKRESMSWSCADKENTPESKPQLNTSSKINMHVKPSQPITSPCTHPSCKMFEKSGFLPNVASVSSSLMKQFVGVVDAG